MQCPIHLSHTASLTSLQCIETNLLLPRNWVTLSRHFRPLVCIFLHLVSQPGLCYLTFCIKTSTPLPHPTELPLLSCVLEGVCIADAGLPPEEWVCQISMKPWVILQAHCARVAKYTKGRVSEDIEDPAITHYVSTTSQSRGYKVWILICLTNNKESCPSGTGEADRYQRVGVFQLRVR